MIGKRWFVFLASAIAIAACQRESSSTTPAPPTNVQPAATSSSSDFEQKKACTDAGWRLVEELRRYYIKEENADIFRPVFTYNAKLNSCFCRFTVGYPDHHVQDWIYDSLSARDVAAYFVDQSGQQASELSKTQFQAKERELLGEIRP